MHATVGRLCRRNIHDLTLSTLCEVDLSLFNSRLNFALLIFVFVALLLWPASITLLTLDILHGMTDWLLNDNTSSPKINNKPETVCSWVRRLSPFSPRNSGSSNFTFSAAEHFRRKGEIANRKPSLKVRPLWMKGKTRITFNSRATTSNSTQSHSIGWLSRRVLDSLSSRLELAGCRLIG